MRIRLALLAAFVALPFAASAGIATSNLEPATIGAGQTLVGADMTAEPPVCNRIETDEATGEATVGCCLVFYMGRYWCVPC